MTHGSKNIPLDFFIAGVKLFQQGFDLPSLGGFGGRTRIDEFGKCRLPGKCSNALLVRKSKWANQLKTPSEKGLRRQHGTDFPGIAHVDEQGLDEIVFVMAQCDLVAPPFLGDFKEPLSPHTGAEKTRVFTIFGAVTDHTIIGIIDLDGITAALSIGFQRLAEAAREPQIDINSDQLVVNGNTPSALVEQPHQGKAVFPATQSDQDSITIRYHVIAVQRLSDNPVQGLIYIIVLQQN